MWNLFRFNSSKWIAALLVANATWILSATVWQRLRGIFTADLGDSLIED
jgi:hypothetical protein